MIKLVHISTTNNERDLKFVNIPVTGSLYRNYTYNELNSPFLVAKKLTITFRILLIRGGIIDTGRYCERHATFSLLEQFLSLSNFSCHRSIEQTSQFLGPSGFPLYSGI